MTTPPSAASSRPARSFSSIGLNVKLRAHRLVVRPSLLPAEKKSGAGQETSALEQLVDARELENGHELLGRLG